MTITYRLVKGAALTHAELDGNFTDLDTTKAEILGNATIAGNGAITATAHANRFVKVTAAAACTITASSAGFADGDFIVFFQEGAGALSITGDVGLSPGVASASTNGIGSVLSCVYSSALGQLIATNRTAASGGGAGALSAYSDHTPAVAPNDTAQNTLASIAIPSLPAGAMIRITADWTLGTQGFQCFLRVNYGGQEAWIYNLAAANVSTIAIDAFIRIKAVGAAAQRVLPVMNGFDGGSQNAATALTVNGAVSQNLTVTCEKVVVGRTVELTSLTVEVITP